jgi:hypothetical protein
VERFLGGSRSGRGAAVRVAWGGSSGGRGALVEVSLTSKLTLCDFTVSLIWLERSSKPQPPPIPEAGLVPGADGKGDVEPPPV